MNELTKTYHQAIASYQKKDYADTIKYCDLILSKQPKSHQTLSLKGLVFNDNKKYVQALELFQQSLAIKKSEVVYNNIGNLYNALLQNELAHEYYDLALAMNPIYVDCLFNKGNCYKSDGKFLQAIEYYKKALAIDKKYVFALNNLSVCYQHLQDFEASNQVNLEALKHYPNADFLHNNLAYGYQTLGQLDLAEHHFLQAAELNQQSDALFNLGFVHLLKGDWEKGWAGHELRHNTKFTYMQMPNQWQGEDLTDKTILIHHEQGFGDVIQFIRYVKLVKELQPKEIIVFVFPALTHLLRSIPEIDLVIDNVQEKIFYDYHCPVMSLPYLFNTRIDNIPNGNYLKPDPKKVAYFGQKLSSKFKVGIVWSGGFRADRPDVWAVNERRNVPFEKLKPLFELDCEWVSLQHGQTHQGLNNIINECKDFADTAALIECLDLVISADTSTCHVAGAIGKQTWLMNRFDSCWRWLLEGTTTQWYPSMTIYRQKQFNQWDDVILNIKQDLIKLLC
jgi:tetratricopeptide (TPR) repeat protein